MTRPLYEPSPTRTDAYLDFQQQQLFRRPAPTSGGGQLPYASMEWFDGGDVPDDSKIGIEDIGGGTPYNFGYINDAGLAMTPQPFAFDFTAGKITFNSSGLYHAQLAVNWADTFPDPSYVFTILDYFGNAPISNNAGPWMDAGVMLNSADWMSNFYVAHGLWIHEQDDDLDSYVHGFVGQVSGTGDKFLSGASLTIVRLTTYDSATGSFFP